MSPFFIEMENCTTCEIKSKGEQENVHRMFTFGRQKGGRMNKPMLKGKIREKDLTQEEAADAIGISRSRFNAKINETHGAEFTKREIKKLKELLSLTAEQIDRIFFS